MAPPLPSPLPAPQPCSPELGAPQCASPQLGLSRLSAPGPLPPQPEAVRSGSAQPLWFALLLPALPLQLAHQALDPTLIQRLPLAITHGPAQRPMVCFCNAAAQAQGVRPGLRLASAQALCATLIVLPREPDREHQAVQQLSAWAYGFSAHVLALPPPSGASTATADRSLTDIPCGLLIETGGSARLFGGQQRLHRHIEQQLNALGLQATCAHAPTPRAAWLIAAARAQQLKVNDVPRAADPTHLHAALAPLPLRLLMALDSFPGTAVGGVIDTLAALGLATFADLLKLPHDAVHRRFGTALLHALLKASGELPDPQPAYLPPARFEASLELPADLTETAQLLLPAQRLLGLLEGFLRGRDAGASLLAFSVGHSPRRAVPQPPTRIVLALAAPERDAVRLSKLLAEQLNRVLLPEPAMRLSLAVEQPQPFAPVHASLLPPAPGAVTARDRDAGWLQLAESLHARLGSDRVYQLRVVEDHRPEHAYAVTPLAVGMSAGTDNHAEPGAASHAETAPPLPPRPLLLLATPLQLSASETAPLASPRSQLLAALAPDEPHGSRGTNGSNAAHGPYSGHRPHGAHEPHKVHGPHERHGTHGAHGTHGSHAAVSQQHRPVLRWRGQLLTLLIGPERIESGWWELDAPGRSNVFRDYFVARTAGGQTVWIFRELQAPQRWFLHGYFA